jgi:DNA-directed RNA polymerase specialized sigma24 family protein
MTNGQLEQLYLALPKILPNHSADARSDAYLAVLEMDNIEPMRNPLPALMLAADRSRKDAYRISKKELLVPVEFIERLGEFVEEGDWDSDGRFFPPFNVEDSILQEWLNATLERLDEDSAQAYILVELRGVSPEEAATILDQSIEELATRVEGVNGLLRSTLSRELLGIC